jgi:hypothetical protein
MHFRLNIVQLLNEVPTELVAAFIESINNQKHFLK